MQKNVANTLQKRSRIYDKSTTKARQKKEQNRNKERTEKQAKIRQKADRKYMTKT